MIVELNEIIINRGIIKEIAPNKEIMTTDKCRLERK
jgi:hypothetical protein